MYDCVKWRKFSRQKYDFGWVVIIVWLNYMVAASRTIDVIRVFFGLNGWIITRNLRSRYLLPFHFISFLCSRCFSAPKTAYLWTDVFIANDLLSLLLLVCVFLLDSSFWFGAGLTFSRCVWVFFMCISTIDRIYDYTCITYMDYLLLSLLQKQPLNAYDIYMYGIHSIVQNYC